MEMMVNEVRQFLATNSCERISKNLRIVFFAYLREIENGMPGEYDEILSDMEKMFDLLEVLRGE